MKGVSSDQVFLVCEKCGDRKSLSSFANVGPNALAHFEGCSMGCRRCGGAMRIPDGSVTNHLFYGLVRDATQKIMRAENPRVEAENLISRLQELTTADQIEAAAQTPEMTWLRQHLPERRDQWVQFINTLMALILAILVWIKTQPPGEPIPPSFQETITATFGAMVMCERALETLVGEAWRSVNPEQYLVALKNKLESLNTKAAFLRSVETTLKWLKPVVVLDPERFGDHVLDLIVFFGLPWLIQKAKERKNRKPNPEEMKQMMEEMHRYGREKKWW